jgi:tetratricopeptide (TPR) repeat protein
MSSQAAPATEALERARASAARAGDEQLFADLSAWGAGPISLGPADAAEMERWIAARADGGGSRFAEFSVDLARGCLATMEYRLDDAREAFARGDSLLRELGLTLLASSFGQTISRVELAVGDVPAAVRVLRASYDEGLALGDRGYHSSTAAMLSEALRRDGQIDEAIEIARVAEEESAPEDVINFASTRGTLGLIAAARGDLEAALEQTARAIAYAERTDLPIVRAEALLARGDVLRAAGREAEAAACFEQAVALAEAKGDQPMRDRALAVAAGKRA